MKFVLVVVFLLLGFVFPLFFILAIVTFIAAFSEASETSRKKTEEHPKTVATTDIEKLVQFRAKCESPAELAFLDAMISTFDLKYTDGALSGRGLKLQSQVAVGRYRLDFLIDKNLVVEVDGAAWHSSPDAIATDAKRDHYLRGQGLEILRIPAKTTLFKPDDAIRNVRIERAKLAERQAERRAELVKQVKVNLKPVVLFANVTNGLKGFGDSVAKMNTYIDQQVELQKEKDVLAIAKTALQLKEIQDQLDADPKLREKFEAVKKRFEKS